MITFYLFSLFETLFMVLPRSWRKALVLGAADLLYRLDPKHRRVIRSNLDFAYDHTLDEAQITDIGRYCYRNLAIAMLQVMENQKQSPAAVKEKVAFQNRHYVDEALAAGRPVIFLTGHFGNWEIAGAAIGSAITPMSAVHKALNNPYFSDYLARARTRFNLSMIEKHGAVKHLSKALKHGKSVTLLFDQNTNKRNGILVDFFGKTVRQTPAPAYLARKYNALIVPLQCRTDDFEHYTVTFYKPIEVAKTDNAEKDVHDASQAMADWLEEEIRKTPKFWFWCHRRWKAEHPEIYDS